MTMTIEYVGPADVRTVRRVDLVEAGLSDPGVDLTWNRANNYEVNVSDATGVWLMVSDTGFRAESGVTPAGIIAENAAGGKQIAYAASSLSQVIPTGTTADITGLTIDFDMGIKNVLVHAHLAWVTALSANQVGVVVIRDAANVAWGQAPFTVLVGCYASADAYSLIPAGLGDDITRKFSIANTVGAGSISMNADLVGIQSFIRAVEV